MISARVLDWDGPLISQEAANLDCGFITHPAIRDGNIFHKSQIIVMDAISDEICTNIVKTSVQGSVEAICGLRLGFAM
ncbi:MAG: hypothetical protein B6D68_02205 [spirochete symbiont of Stewartia floridana]|nr:MAG: hypothetical protein B6D68_02205 [spirochete symbiont of Stewartia floridana]